MTVTGAAVRPWIATTYPGPARRSRKRTLPAASVRRLATLVPPPSRRTAVAPSAAPVTATWFTLGWTWNVAATAAAAPAGADGAAGASKATTRSATPATGSRRRNTAKRYPRHSAWHDHRVTKVAGTHVIITGGSSGIGLETARLAESRGARVSLVARDPDRLAAASASLERALTAS